MRFDLLWRRSGQEHLLASTEHLFTAGKGVTFETDLQGAAADAESGDELVLRFSTISGPGNYTPNGDGELVGARIPNLKLP